MTCSCIRCENENAFFNGLQYECPDCNAVWDDPNFVIGSDDDDDDNYVDPELRNKDDK